MATDKITAALSTLKGEKDRIEKDIAEVRAQERDLKNQIVTLRGMPISLDDYGIYLRAHIDALGEEWLQSINPHWLISPSSARQDMRAEPWSRFEFDSGEFNVGPLGCYESRINQGNPISAMCYLQPAVVFERLMAGYRDKLGSRWGNEELPTVEQRRVSIAEMGARIEKLREQLAALERELAGITGALGIAPDALAVVTDRMGAPAQAAGLGPLKGQRLPNPDLASQR